MAPDSDVIGRRTHPLTAVVQGLGWSAAAVAGLLGTIFRDGGPDDWAAMAVVVAALAGVLLGSGIGWLSWRFTTYVIDDTQIRIDSGIIWRNSRRVPFERLQSVDIHEPVVARALGLAELHLDSAGGSQSRTTVRYLKLEQAQVLRALLLRRAHAAHDPYSTPPIDPANADAPDPDSASEVIAEVSPWQVILATLVSLDLLAAIAIAVAAVIASIWFSAPLAALGGLLGAGSWALRIIGTRIIEQWGYRLVRVPHGLRIERGLVSRTSETIPFDRVQGVAINDPLIWRQLRWRHVLVAVAGQAGAGSSGGSDADQSSATVLPIATAELAERVVDLLVPGANEDVPNRHRPARRGWIFAPIGWRYRWLGSDHIAVVSRHGWINRRTDIVPHRKIQSIAIEQGPLQSILGVATVQVHSPDGPVGADIRHLDQHEALIVASQASMRSRSSS